MSGKFFINIIRYLTIIQMVISLVIISTVFDDNNSILENKILSLVNFAVSLFAFLYFVANCSELECQKFLLAQKQKGIEVLVIIIVVVRAVLASFLLEFYLNDNGGKTIYLIASIIAFVAVLLVLYLMIYGAQTKHEQNIQQSLEFSANPQARQMIKPYHSNHLTNIRKAIHIKPRGARFIK